MLSTQLESTMYAVDGKINSVVDSKRTIKISV